MATLAAVVQKHYKKKDGTYNIQIRVTHNREVCYFSTQHYVSGKQISKNLTRIKDPVVLDAVNLQIAALRKEITKISYINKYTAKGLAEYLKNIDKRSEGINFIEFTEQIYREVKKASPDSCTSLAGPVNLSSKIILESALSRIFEPSGKSSRTFAPLLVYMVC